MQYKRREFLKITTTLGSGLLLSSVSNNLFAFDGSKKGLGPFGIQLYTLRTELPKDPKGVLKQVASYGFKQIESFEGSMGMFWGMKNTEFKKYMDDLGMKIVSSHCDINKDFDRKAEEAAAIGMKYLICPYLGPKKTVDEFKTAAETFNKRGEVCKKNGLRFAYHNHDYGFKPIEGQMPQNVLMQNTDKSLVDFEMDIYWVVTAGQDPIEWLNKYPNRFRLCHVKDRQKDAAPDKKDAFAVLGTGKIDFPKILKVAKKNGMEYYINEQDQTYDVSPLVAAKENAEYLKNLKI